MISIVIPTYTLNKELESLAIQAILSYKKQADEIIVSEDGGKFSLRLQMLADIYCYGKKNKGFTANVNIGWKLATGDYVAIVNSDTHLIRGNLKDLCIPGKVTSPEIVNQNIPHLAGPFWVTPKEVTKERGYLVEAMKTYCSDSEYDHRVRDIFQKVPSVKIWHHMAQTVKPAGVEGGVEQAKDRKAYEEYKSLLKRKKEQNKLD